MLIKKGSVLVFNKDNSFQAYKVRVLKVIEIDGDIILQLKTYKNFPTSHKIIYRSLNEII